VARPVFGGRSSRQPLVILLASLVTLPVSHPGRANAEAPAAIDRPADPQALVAALRERILASDSATLALESWCAEHRLAADPHLVAQRLPGPDKPLTAAQRARLAIGPDEPVRYRRVRLVCGDHVMSEADNWYVPARLTPEMNAVLDGTHTPFGRVVRPLAPVRRTVEVRARTADAAARPDDPLFEVDAVLATRAGQPFCEVVETYLGTALPSASR
jgi:chorismate-pyruvate lyase